jgi:hypothetical protein
MDGVGIVSVPSCGRYRNVEFTPLRSRARAAYVRDTCDSEVMLCHDCGHGHRIAMPLQYPITARISPRFTP